MKKTTYRKPIILGFLVVYVMSMYFSTNILARSYQARHSDDWNEKVSIFQHLLSSVDENPEIELNENLASYILSYVIAMHTELEYNQFSAAVYDRETGEKIAQSGVLMTDGINYTVDMNREPCHSYAVGKYMTKEELEKLVKIELDTRSVKEVDDYPLYFYNFFVNKETNEPMAFEILKLNWDKEVDGGIFHPLNSQWAYDGFDLEWRWYHPDTEFKLYEIPSIGEIGVTEKIYAPNEEYEELSQKVYSTQQFMYYNLGIVIPYLNNGYKSWERWQLDEHLQNFPDLLPDEKATIENYSMFEPYKTEGYFEYGMDYVLVVRRTSNVWLAAMDYMKPVYLTSFIIMFACMMKVLYATEKTYKERAKLEETRRDFTNAIAHELKTPLGVIRGFSENLKENTNEDKREYYLDQIVGQTERMDEMVKEMIYISKMDSDKLVLDKKEVSLKQLVEETLESLSIYIEEKHLQISYEGLSDRVIQGDSQYLKKAIWNLVSNAVEYNRQNGQVKIIFEESALKIRNTGKQIPEEDLPYVFDMFYTGNKSRTSGESHLGLGLYLAKKIFDLHGLLVSIGNIEDGVEVTITR